MIDLAISGALIGASIVITIYWLAVITTSCDKEKE